ncbi:MAG: ABC transporter permease [Dehalococcoidia bacterium]
MTSQTTRLQQVKTVIAPPDGWIPVNLRELWQYRDLLLALTQRTISIRYKQTLLGASWAIIQPVAMMVVFNVVALLGDLPTDGLPRPIFLYTALLPWQLFATGLATAGNSIASNQNLVTKVYFPRVVLPISAVLPGLVDFAIALAVLAGLMAYYHVLPGVEVLTAPLFLLLAMVTALGVGLWLAAINVRFRDVRLALPFAIQLWLFLTTVIYTTSAVPERWRVIYGMNPMTSVVEGFRWALLGKGELPWAMLAVSVAMAMAVLISGMVFFRRAEQEFADIV